MKWLLRSVPIFALMLVACTTTNNPVTNIYNVDSTKPTITRFSPDTVWTFGNLTIYGTHFGYDGNDVHVTIDTTQVGVSTVNDTIMTLGYVPENTQTGFIRVATINGTTTSTKPVVVEYTFSPHTINDTLPIGASFSIPGTGMNHSHGQLRLQVAGVVYPIDSVFPNRIVSHVVANGLSGSVTIYDSSGSYSGGTLMVTRLSAWNTLSIIWDHVNVTETHTRTGYVNGPANTIDSTWKITATYLGQHDVNVSGVPFSKLQTGVLYTIAVPYLQIDWDTITQTAEVYYYPTSSSNTPTLTLDTTWDIYAYSLPAMLPVTNAIEFTLPNFSYRITEDSTDTQGLVSWQETTTTTLNSGSFDLILKP
jgi:IPT/TIG domain